MLIRFPPRRILIPAGPPSRAAAALSSLFGSKLVVAKPSQLAKLAIPRVADLVVSDAAVPGARIPVLTARKDLELRELLCPVNMTHHSAVALSYAALLAQAADASLTALYVRPEAIREEDAKLLLRRFVHETLGSSPAVRLLVLSSRQRCDTAVLSVPLGRGS